MELQLKELIQHTPCLLTQVFVAKRQENIFLYSVSDLLTTLHVYHLKIGVLKPICYQVHVLIS